MDSTPETDPVGHEYARHAAYYDRRWSFYVEATVRETVARLRLRSGEAVLDVGCGTGALLAALAETFPGTRRVGVDPSPEMLGVARARLQSSAALCQGRAEDLPFRDGAFDLVVSTSVLHHLAEPDTALREMRRVLKPQGRLVITDWCHDYLACRLYGVFAKLVRRAPIRIYGSEEFRALLGRAGLAAIRVERYKIDWLWGLMTAAAERDVTGEAG